MNSQEINSILDSLAERLQTPTEHLWAVLIAQAQVVLVGWVGLIAIASVVSVLTVLSYRKMQSIKYNSNEGWVLLTVLIGGLGIALWIGVCAVGYDALTAVMNPEYYALREVFRAFQ